MVIFLQQRNCLSRVEANTFGCQVRTPKLVVVGGGRRLLVSSELAYRHSAGCHIAITTAVQPHSRCPILPHSQIELPYYRTRDSLTLQFCAFYLSCEVQLYQSLLLLLFKATGRSPRVLRRQVVGTLVLHASVGKTKRPQPLVSEIECT